MKHILSYRNISESNSLIEAGIQFDCISIERTDKGYEIQFVDHSLYYQGKDYAEVLSSMLKEKEILVAKGMLGLPLKVEIGKATSDALKKVFETDDIEDIRKKMKIKGIVDFEDGKADFLETLESIEDDLGRQIEINNGFIRNEVSNSITGWKSVVDVGMAEDI